MKLLSLFSGIGGIDLAAQWAGIETVAFCERDKFCQKVLAKHWPDVPIFDDIKNLTKEVLENAGIGRIDIVAGGFPCQPFSQAGKRRGSKDDRHLWPEMLRIIETLRPPWVLGENVTNFANMGFDDALDDLEAAGYFTAPAFDIPAMAFDLQTVERHLWFVSSSDRERLQRDVKKSLSRLGLGTWEPSGSDERKQRGSDLVKSRVCRIRKRFPHWMDRIRALGNAVVPQQIYPIFQAIIEVNNANKTRKQSAISEKLERDPRGNP